MNNRWNKIVYKGWSAFYDRFFNTGMFLKARYQIFQDLPLPRGRKILFVGVGTGANLPFFIYKGYEITCIDYSPDMLKVAKEKYSDASVSFLEMIERSISLLLV